MKFSECMEHYQKGIPIRRKTWASYLFVQRHNQKATKKKILVWETLREDWEIYEPTWHNEN